MHWEQAQERHTTTTTASGATRAPSAWHWPPRTLGHSSSANRRVDLQQVLCGLSRRLQPREGNSYSALVSGHNPPTLSSGHLSKALPDALPARPRRSSRLSQAHDGWYASCQRLQDWQSVAQAKGLHSAVEKRTLHCTMKRDCARHERRRRKRRGRGRAHRHWALFSCTLLRLQNYRFTGTHNRA
jgi:hypothetical protein